MITKNGMNLIAAKLSENGGNDTQLSYPFVYTSGTSGQITVSYRNYGFDRYCLSYSSYSLTNSGIYVGSGTTSPSIGDYAPEQMFSSTDCTISASNVPSIEVTDSYIEWIKVFTVFAKKNITVSEIGIIGSPFSNANTTSTILIERTVLDNPVYIPANASKTIEYRIRFNYPRY